MSKRNHPGPSKKRLPSQKSNSIIQPSNMAGSGGDTLLKGDILDYAEMMRKLINNQEYSCSFIWDEESSLMPMLLSHLLQPACDLKFYIGPNRKIIYAHRCIMSARCAVFKAMLAEKSNSDDKDVPYVLPDVSPAIFLAMLEFIYTNCVTLSPNTATDLLATALEYGLDGFRDLCVDYLVTNLSISNACEVMQSAVTYNQNDLKEKALVFIEDNTAEVVKSKSFQEINEDALVAILRSSRLTIDEMDLCKAVMDWSSVNSVVNGKKINEMARDAVKHLRLSLLSPNELTTLEEENKATHFIPVESFAYAWKMHALKCGDGDNVLSTLRRGTVSREHHKYLTNKNTE